MLICMSVFVLESLVIDFIREPGDFGKSSAGMTGRDGIRYETPPYRCCIFN